MAAKLKGIKRNYSAKTILALLAARHSADVFIPECKDGPTHYSTHLRLDAWVMNKSWANACATGYEIKVSRADFVGDNKWIGYLPLCNQFYFVTPPGIINPSELSPDAGLMVVAGEGSGTRLLIKKKAPHRTVKIPEEVYRYVLMCRVKVAAEDPQTTEQERWQNWLARKAEDRYLGHEVSKAIRERAQEIESENTRLKNAMYGYDKLRTVLEELGATAEGWHAEQNLRDQIVATRTVFDRKLVNAMRGTQRTIEAALAEVDRVELEAVATIQPYATPCALPAQATE